MQEQWIREGQGFLLVYSITNEQTLYDVEVMRDLILRTKDTDGEDTPIVLVGNKCDLETNRQITIDQGEELADQWKCKFFETSAKMAINNKECFYEVVRQIRRRTEDFDDDKDQKGKNKKNKKKKKKKKFKDMVCTFL